MEGVGGAGVEGGVEKRVCVIKLGLGSRGYERSERNPLLSK